MPDHATTADAHHAAKRARARRFNEQYKRAEQAQRAQSYKRKSPRRFKVAAR